MPHNSYFHRRHLILNIIHHLGPISRTELIHLTDYRPATVTEIIKELLEERLITESGSCSVGHGRNRTLLEINKSHLCAIGMSFSSDCVTFIVSQFDGLILRKDTISLSPDSSKEALITNITEHIKGLLSDYKRKEILGIGIGEPFHDPARYQSGTFLSTNHANFNDWVHQGLKPQLESRFGLRVETYSEVVLPVMAERRFGAAIGAQNFFCVELSNGIGCSICCNGVAVGGANGLAGELGHTVIDYSSSSQRLCYCGKPGCAENTTAFPALVAELDAALKKGVFSSLSSYMDSDSGITVGAIRKALDEKDRMCMHYVKNVATRLGVTIANAVNLLNPELIVLYGFMLELGDYFLSQLETSIRENVLSLAGDFDIRFSDSLETLLPLGAVAEIFASYLHSESYKWVYDIDNYSKPL